MAVYKQGSAGDEVKNIQSLLNATGQYNLKVDGVYGDQTASAVKDYQSRNNLKVDGIAGDNTLSSLNSKKTASTPVSTTTSAQNVVQPVATTQPAISTAQPQQTIAPSNSAALNALNVSSYYGAPAQEYSSQYQEQLNAAIQALNNYAPYDYSSYDPEKDAAFVAFRDNAIQQGNRAYASNLAASASPGVAGSSVATKIAQAGKDAYVNQIQQQLPTFAEQARSDYENQFAQKLQAANLLMTADSTMYDRFATDRNYAANQAQQYTENTGFMPVNTSNITADDPLRQITDYAAEIDRRKKSNPNDALIPVLEALRYEKVMNDPAMYALYSSTVSTPSGYQTMASRNYDSEVARDEERYQTQLALQAEQTAFDRAMQQAELAVKQQAARNSGSSANTVGNLGALYTGMVESGDPKTWLQQYGSYLTDAEFKALQGYADDYSPSSSDAFRSATDAQKSAYDQLYGVYVDGNSLVGSEKNQYYGNPQAAITQMERQASTNKEQLGPLYDVLLNQLKEAQKSAGSNIDSIAQEMMSAGDPYSIIDKYKSALTQAQIDDLYVTANRIRTARDNGGSSYAYGPQNYGGQYLQSFIK